MVLKEIRPFLSDQTDSYLRLVVFMYHESYISFGIILL